ncbi:MAG: hypothetical protein ACK5M1_04660 [Xanthomarina gelatinilytica]|uniref:hypothetical protein n=1 Tax=Xanthomarina gelatinilytica TaxID=1137281 RepID=UPI003A8868F1
MKNTKFRIFYAAIGLLIRGLWKLLLLGLYAVAKLMEVMAGFTTKILEKLLN